MRASVAFALGLTAGVATARFLHRGPRTVQEARFLPEPSDWAEPEPEPEPEDGYEPEAMLAAESLRPRQVLLMREAPGSRGNGLPDA